MIPPVRHHRMPAPTRSTVTDLRIRIRGWRPVAVTEARTNGEAMCDLPHTRDRAPALSILSGGCDWMGARADEVASAVAVGVGGKNELAA
jgi:hypothetical protein